ncbi:MAG: TlpA disulfide reductase family protein [Chloroflexota bacterium]
MKSVSRILAAFLLLAVSLSVAAAAGGCVFGGPSSSGPTGTTGTRIGDQAPDFVLPVQDGVPVALSNYLGRPVLLNFWASWCGPCREEMPYINEISNDPAWASTGLVVLTVNVNEPPEVITAFLEENGYKLTVLRDDGQKVSRQYNLRGIPTSYFISSDGIIRDVVIGSFPDKAAIEKRLGSITGEG